MRQLADEHGRAARVASWWRAERDGRVSLRCPRRPGGALIRRPNEMIATGAAGTSTVAPNWRKGPVSPSRPSGDRSVSEEEHHHDAGRSARVARGTAPTWS